MNACSSLHGSGELPIARTAMNSSAGIHRARADESCQRRGEVGHRLLLSPKAHHTAQPPPITSIASTHNPPPSADLTGHVGLDQQLRLRRGEQAERHRKQHVRAVAEDDIPQVGGHSGLRRTAGLGVRRAGGARRVLGVM